MLENELWGENDREERGKRKEERRKVDCELVEHSLLGEMNGTARAGRRLVLFESLESFFLSTSRRTGRRKVSGTWLVLCIANVFPLIPTSRRTGRRKVSGTWLVLCIANVFPLIPTSGRTGRRKVSETGWYFCATRVFLSSSLLPELRVDPQSFFRVFLLTPTSPRTTS